MTRGAGEDMRGHQQASFHPFLFHETVVFTQERSLLDTCSPGAEAGKQQTLRHFCALKGDAGPLANAAPAPHPETESGNCCSQGALMM